MALKVDEWERAILNTLLRTGGYLKWTDIAALETTVVPGLPGSNLDSANRFLKQFQKVVSSHGKSGEKVVDLCPHFKKCGLKDCKEDIVPLDIPEYTSVVNENFVKALEHILQAASLAADQVDDTLSMDEIALLRESAVKNLEDTKSRFRGVLHVVIGKKSDYNVDSKLTVSGMISDDISHILPDDISYILSDDISYIILPMKLSNAPLNLSTAPFV
ncbi:conserved hypothetical protein [Histoplasma capsulatum H143]|uniref:Uncharacterized protein n=1 Tax=Ajellomyces capsulatus (strain H143) TaxID=544712 RepID=C6HJA7_AJECH|nr:conserved hypothetical protein [Histoplasma capsulatum H143]